MGKRKIIIMVLALAVVLAFIFWRFGPSILPQSFTPPGAATLTYWGLWEDDNLIRPLIEEYHKQNPLVTINYVRQSSLNYRTRVQTQIRAGTGPDVFMLHNSWTGMFAGDLAPAPLGVIGLSEFQTTFYPVAAESFIKNNQILGLPIETDGLALYLNEDILKGVGGVAPRTWQEFVDLATKTTVKDSSGQIKTAGAALGTTSNVDHWSDILGLLFLQQPGIDLTKPFSPAAAEVLKFYTGFVTDPRRKVWDANMPSSTQAFTQGRLAFYFAPSWRAQEIHQANPNLKFRVVPVPQLGSKQVGWASFWGGAVAAKSKNQTEAWKFLKFLTSKQAQTLAYTQASQVRLLGEPYARQDLAGAISNDPIVGAFVNQGAYYKTWYLCSSTQDVGINDEMIKYFEDGVNTTLQGTDPQTALQTVSKGVQQVLDKYTKPAPAVSQR